MVVMATKAEPLRLKVELEAWVKVNVAGQGSDSHPVRPKHYEPWRWPLPAVSHSYHIPVSEWHGRTILHAEGDDYEVVVARTPWGVFGRCEALRAEAKGDSDEEMLDELLGVCEPLFVRRRQVGDLLGLDGPYRGRMRELDDISLLKLFYAPDRAISHDAQNALETRGRLAEFGPALVSILKERDHRNRRTAQWLVLDLFEDLSSYCPTSATESEAVQAIKTLMWEANDDYARTIYKAGVVLGGHVCTPESAATIIELMNAPSKIARRSAMHASFHLCEWMPTRKDQVLRTLEEASQNDPEPLLRGYCAALAKDVKNEVIDHVAEPIFPEEL